MRRLLLVAALLASLVGAADARAKTTVTVSGTEIVIHVPIQMAGLKGRTMRNPLTGERYDDAQLADFMARESERFWNEGATGADEFFGEKPSGGLSKLRYGDCFTIRIEVEIVATAVFEGGTQVRLEGYHYILFDNNPNGRMVVWDPATPDPTKDTSSAYDQSLEGEWTSWEDYFGGGGHEIGHLLGLGDDYNDKGALPGREDTVMDHGRKFDQNIVDRIVELVKQSGIKLPECWKGTITEDFAPGGGRIVGEGPVQLAVDAEGAVTGRGSITFIRCALPNCHVVGHTESLTFSGTRTDRGFRLTTTGPGGSVSFPVPVEGTTVRHREPLPHRSSITLKLECVSCR